MAYGAREAAEEWWNGLVDALRRRGWLIAENELEGPVAVIRNGWYLTRRRAVSAMEEAIAEELADPDADDTLPVGEVLAFVEVCSRKHFDFIGLPDDPEAAAAILHNNLNGRPV